MSIEADPPPPLAQTCAEPDRHVGYARSRTCRMRVACSNCKQRTTTPGWTVKHCRLFQRCSRPNSQLQYFWYCNCSMSKRYWFYVTGWGSLDGLGEHRVCFSSNDDEASLLALLQSVFSVKRPAFKLYIALDQQGNVMHHPEMRAAQDALRACEEGEEDTVDAGNLAFVSINAMLADLQACVKAVTQPSEQPDPPPTLYYIVDCEPEGARTPTFLYQCVPTGLCNAASHQPCTCSCIIGHKAGLVHSQRFLTYVFVAARKTHHAPAPGAQRAPHPSPPPAMCVGREGTSLRRSG